MAHKATHAIEPSYLVWNDFQADKNRALVDDALPTTHSIWAPVETPSQAIEMFDVITYQKGCAVMRMLENFLGEERFMAGLRTYMKAFAYQNAAGADLWRHLEGASGQPVGALMRSWVEQPGFPIVTFSEESAPDGGAVLKMEQHRFYSSPKASSAPSEQTWSVPVVTRFEDATGVKEHRFILDKKEQREKLPATGAVKWVCANADEDRVLSREPGRKGARRYPGLWSREAHRRRADGLHRGSVGARTKRDEHDHPLHPGARSVLGDAAITTSCDRSPIGSARSIFF